MKVLVVYCHPSPESFTAAVRDRVLKVLDEAGAEVTLFDLYAEGFDPVLNRRAFERYLELIPDDPYLVRAITALKTCEALIFVYPTWWYGLPAMLKGWLDRVMLPDVAFHLPETGPIEPRLRHIRQLAIFTSCGASWWLSRFIGEPGRRTIMRGVGLLCARPVRKTYLAHYRMDDATDESRARHLDRVEAAARRLLR